MMSISRATTRLAIPISVIAALAIAPSRLASQQGPTSASGRLTLTEAWAKAESRNDYIAIASARSERAAGGALETSSSRKPRLSAFSAYDRTLRSEFDGLMGFSPDTTAPSDEESAEIPFGSAHAYRAGLTASYTVFSGGRGLAQSRAAAATRRSAEIGERTTRAQVRLDVTEAYYDAMLAERLHAIAAWTFEQAESTYRRVAMLSEAGRVPEFDVVRAKAMRDRGRPAVIQRRAERDIALLRLRQLLHVPASTPLNLPADILDNLAAFPSLGGELGTREWVTRRAAVRDATEAVTQREQALHASEAGRLPAVALTSTYERVAYPLEGTPSWKSSRANWTVGARLELPLLTGGRQRGSDMQARADLDAARARLRLTRDAAELDTRASLARLAAAEASFEATRATVQEAERAYEIATLRYKEGMSIQLELSDARLLLEQARADQARAARDVSIERVRATLLSDLPLADQPPTT
jgi:outer membrane protein